MSVRGRDRRGSPDVRPRGGSVTLCPPGRDALKSTRSSPRRMTTADPRCGKSRHQPHPTAGRNQGRCPRELLGTARHVAPDKGEQGV